MFSKNIRLLVLCAFLLTVGCSDEGDPVDPGDPPTNVAITTSKDNTLYEWDVSDPFGPWSNGAGQTMFVGQTKQGGPSGEPPENRRAVMKFDVAGAGIPAGATVDSVILTLNMSKTNPAAGPREAKLYRLLTDWGEGTSAPLLPDQEGGGAAAEVGDATWVHTFFNSATWTTPGGDFAMAARDSQMVDALGTYTWGTTAAMVADVQDWLDNPSNNFGWILVGDESTHTTAKRFDTRENATAANRPSLFIHYTVP